MLCIIQYDYRPRSTGVGLCRFVSGARRGTGKRPGKDEEEEEEKEGEEGIRSLGLIPFVFSLEAQRVVESALCI